MPRPMPENWLAKGPQKQGGWSIAFPLIGKGHIRVNCPMGVPMEAMPEHWVATVKEYPDRDKVPPGLAEEAWHFGRLGAPRFRRHP